jgi:hypothetical protein
MGYGRESVLSKGGIMEELFSVDNIDDYVTFFEDGTLSACTSAPFTVDLTR